MRKKPAYRQHEKMGGGDPLKVAGLKDDEKLLKKHGINVDKMLKDAQRLIKAYERGGIKHLKEVKPKYKH
jgi:hypothetical protein